MAWRGRNTHGTGERAGNAGRTEKASQSQAESLLSQNHTPSHALSSSGFKVRKISLNAREIMILFSSFSFDFMISLWESKVAPIKPSQNTDFYF